MSCKTCGRPSKPGNKIKTQGSLRKAKRAEQRAMSRGKY